jgi:hypothetical protein
VRLPVLFTLYDMKKILGFVFMAALLLTQTACFQKQDFTFDERTLVEFQETITLTPATGLTYPLISVNNGAGAVTRRVNLVGRQRTSAETITFTVVADASTAVQGVHYNLNGGTFQIPANSSFGDCTINILQAPQGTAGQTVRLVLQLEGNGGDILPNENYKRIGYTIRL